MTVKYFLSASLALALSGVSALEYQRTESGSAEVYPREKVIPRTQVYAENQLPYNLMQNTLYRWGDRPLFADPALRQSGWQKSWERDIEICRQMGLDGLASLHHYGLYFRRLEYFRSAVPGYRDLFVLPAYLKPEDAETTRAIRAAMNSPFTAKLNGKLLIWNYGGMENDRVVQFARYYRTLPEFKDRLLFFGDVPFIQVYHAYYRTEAKGGTMPEDVLRDFEAKCREVFDNCDGMILWLNEHERDAYSDYAYHILPTPIYRKYILPTVQKLLKEEKYRRKLIGTYPRYCYINRFIGGTFGEFGTEGIRTYMDESLRINPDMMVLFEWNEAAENTYFQPSVNNGRCLERILNFYLQKLRGEPYSGRPGDCAEIPQLIFTARKKVCLGEVIHLEMLNLPDRNVPEEYPARLMLKNESGKTVAEFPVETFRRNEMKAVTYRLASEQFADCRVLIPEITAGGRTYQGFGEIEIHPTVCKEYKSVLNCLRDLVPAETEFSVRKLDGDSYEIQGKVKSEEPLAQAEVLAGNEEVWAYDRTGEFDSARYEVFTGIMTSHSVVSGQKGRLSVENSSDWKIRTLFFPYQNLGIELPRFGSSVRIECGFRGGRSPFVLAVPKNEAGKAVLKIQFDNGEQAEIPLAKVLKNRVYAYNFPSCVRLDLGCADLLPDMAPLIDRKEIEFRTVVKCDEKEPVFQLRLIDRKGRLLRQTRGPVLPSADNRKTLTVFSDYLKKPVEVQADAALVPVLDYRFDDSRGARLASGWENRFDLSIGGGFDYGEPMNRGQGQFLSQQSKTVMQPQLTAGPNGRMVLRFSGRNEYFCLPQEVIPHNSCYTVDFEILPRSGADQILLRNRLEGRSSGLELVIANGELRGIFYGRMHAPVIHDTGLKLKIGEWNRIRIFKKYTELVYEVNGQRKTFPYDRRAERFSQGVFGALPAPGSGIPEKAASFNGDLRKFRIVHFIEK